MSLTAADVAEIMRLVEQSTFDELTLEIDGIKLHLRRGAAAQTTAPTQTSFATDGTQGRANATPATESASAASGTRSGVEQAQASLHVDASAFAGAAPAAPGVQDVTAPLLGTFYRAPKPGAPPFVEVGATVEEDTVVAIIEVMKLMNTVRAGVRGTVTEILARDGVLVEYGETLLRVRKS